jgi:hypothetical protein
VSALLAPFLEHLELIQVDGRAAGLFRERLAAGGFDPQIAAFDGYASVRNLQLLAPAALGAEVIVALDDDEVVPHDFMRRATAVVGASIDGARALGLAGAYEDENGEIYLPEADPTGNPLIDKAIYMNRAFRELESAPGRLAASPLALGGNMVFHRDLFSRVGFDPAITRGEDIDYLINARLAGYPFYYDQNLRVTHLPPRHYESPAYVKLRQDVIRFLYEREKIKQGGLSPEAFDPYPGALLRPGMEAHALEILRQEATQEMVHRYGRPRTIVSDALAYGAERVPRYFSFAERWPTLVEACAGDVALSEIILG